MDRRDRSLHAEPHGQDFFRGILEDFYAMRRAMGCRHREAWQPPTDVYETEDDVVIKMCLPGVQPDDIAVEINGELISVCGVRHGPDKGSVAKYHQMEIHNGYFERRIVVRLPMNPQDARGEYKDGFAYIYIPKAREPVRRVVRLRVEL